MKFTQNNYEDLKKYFEKSYMKFPKLGEQAVFVDKVSSEGLSGSLLPANGEYDGWKYTFTEGSALDFEYILPKKSFFEYRGVAYLLERIPAQQYKRGLCRDNCSIRSLTVSAGFTAEPLSLELINAYTMKQNFSGFRKDNQQESYPVSSRMAVDATGKLYIDSIRIGVYSDKTNTIELNHSLFLPEVEAVLSTNQQRHIQITTARDRPVRKTKVLQTLDAVLIEELV